MDYPIDLTREILEEKSLGIDEDGFNAAMKRQKEQARAAEKDDQLYGRGCYGIPVHRSVYYN